MHEDLAPLLKNLPPKTKRALDDAIRFCGEQIGMEPGWVQRWLSFTLVADALARYEIDGAPAFEIKGGAAIELRMRRLAPRAAGGEGENKTTTIQPRATKDLDAAFHGEMHELEAAVQEALSRPHPDFTFRAEIEMPDAPHMRRFRVRVSYLQKGGVGGVVVPKDLNSVKLEVSCYEGTRYPPEMVPAYSLKPFGIQGPEELPCLTLPKQIAQKLHAVTEVLEGDRINDRFRDLVDLVMLSVLMPPSPQLRLICEETFKIREKQTWPPEIKAHDTWRAAMEQRAGEMKLETTKADEIVAHVSRYVAGIAGAE